MRAIIVPVVTSVLSFCGYHAYQSHTSRGPERGYGHTVRPEVRTAEASHPDYRLKPYGHDRIDAHSGYEGSRHHEHDANRTFRPDHAAGPDHRDRSGQQQRLTFSGFNS